MSKERLKEIKYMIGMFDGDVEITLFGHKIRSDYVMGEFKWLYQRVQELEGERDEWRDTSQSYYMTNQELRGQNKRYRKKIEVALDMSKKGSRDDTRVSNMQYVLNEALEESE